MAFRGLSIIQQIEEELHAMMRLRRVFVLVPDCHSKSGHYGPLWQRHFIDGIRGVVEDVLVPLTVDFSWARGEVPTARAVVDEARNRTSESLFEEIRRAHGRFRIDAVLSYCFAADIADPEQLVAISNQQVETVIGAAILTGKPLAAGFGRLRTSQKICHQRAARGRIISGV